jgi:DNA-binding response OmpR family regulator
VQLTDHEYRVLDCLLRHSPRAVSLACLHMYTWGERLPKRSRSQIATVTVSRLRQRLRRLALPLDITHVHEFGYVLRTCTTSSQGRNVRSPVIGQSQLR